MGTTNTTIRISIRVGQSYTTEIEAESEATGPFDTPTQDFINKVANAALAVVAGLPGNDDPLPAQHPAEIPGVPSGLDELTL